MIILLLKTMTISYFQTAESESSSEDEVEIEETPEYLKYLQSLDPKEWKVSFIWYFEYFPINNPNLFLK
jgi:hypothetical protein